MTAIRLYGNWRSSCAHRIRIGLRLKGLDYEEVPISLDAREQELPSFSRLHPVGQLPLLEVGGHRIGQSVAQLEFIEDRFPDVGRALLPRDPMARAQVRELVHFVASVVQPFLFARRVRPHLEAAVGLDSGDARLVRFIREQLERNMQTLNELLERVSGPFAFGDSPSMADCVVIPQAVGAARMGIDVNRWHRISSVSEACHRLPEFAAAHPLAQSDAPSSNPATSAPAPVGHASMRYKQPAPDVHAYLDGLNREIPGLDGVRRETHARFGPVATKLSAIDVVRFLSSFVRATAPKTVVEVGVFTGSWTLAVLDALPEDGLLVAFDVEPAYTKVAVEAVREAGLTARFDLRLVDAAEGVPALAELVRERGPIDLAFVDGLNTQYRQNFEGLLPLMRVGGTIIFDNVLWRGQVAGADGDAQTRHLRMLNNTLANDPRVTTTFLSLGDGLALATVIEQPRA